MCWLWKEPLWSRRFEQYTLFVLRSFKPFSWGRTEYTVLNVKTTTPFFRANTSPYRDLYMVVLASLLVIVTSYYPHHAKLQTSLKKLLYIQLNFFTWCHFIGLVTNYSCNQSCAVQITKIGSSHKSLWSYPSFCIPKLVYLFKTVRVCSFVTEDNVLSVSHSL